MPHNKIRSILVIDDDQDDFDLVAEAIHGIDPDIEVAYLSSCEEAAHYRKQAFDLVFLDINMPAHDGFSWLKGIRERGYELPIIMYTNSASPAHVLKAYTEGATLYFNKPENFNTLRKGIQKLLNLDWANPFYIKEMHVQNGRYQTFQVA